MGPGAPGDGRSASARAETEDPAVEVDICVLTPRPDGFDVRRPRAEPYPATPWERQVSIFWSSASGA